MDAEQFRSGWFMLSLMTEYIALLVLRTGRPFWRSRPIRPLVLSSGVVVLVGVLLPMTGVGALLGMQPITFAVFTVICALAFAYVLLNEAMKVWWKHRWNWLST